ncbi:MAG TPA: alpha-amylase/4-alpha-glucanotransferase domain-containing protein, partial [Candidatus Polarisedimenticolia bacterium]|nr:alpha-amylase/4-alpha-glucanotransferase domain-containing protein [Candidatus Polarisedimenticolia bacterium]
HEWVYGEHWLEQFFAFLEEPEGGVRAVQPQDVLRTHPVARKVYMPNASYTEMLEWALPAGSVASYGRVRDAAVERAGSEAARAFVRGSLWDMFLARYPEADQLHKHVLWTSRRARALPKNEPLRGLALDAVLRAECNCAYWHGMFGGIYYSHLRHGLYHALLEGDQALHKSGRGSPLYEETDIDGDLEPEVILRASRLQAFFRPADAGTLVELDDLKSRFNVTNVLSRSREAYHEGSDRTHGGEGASGVVSPHELAVGMTERDREALVFDTLPLRSLRDFTAAEVPSPGGLSRFTGMTLASGRPAAWRATPDGFRMRLDRPGFPFERRVRLDPEGRLEVSWDGGDDPPEGVFGTLLALTLLTPDDPDRLRRIVRDGAPDLTGPPGAPLSADGATQLVLEDKVFGFALEVGLDPPAHIVATPIETLQRAEVRYEKAYQGTLFALCWRFPRAAPPPQADRALTLTLVFRDHPVT